jgi:acetyltransferase-like isoleucine patch superfamily enzyme
MGLVAAFSISAQVAGIQFEHSSICKERIGTGNGGCVVSQDDDGLAACIDWIDDKTPSSFHVHASAAADGDFYLIPFPTAIVPENGSATLHYFYAVPYSAYREVTFDTHYCGSQLQAHFPVISRGVQATARAGAETSSNCYYEQASVRNLTFGGLELGISTFDEPQAQVLCEAEWEEPQECYPENEEDYNVITWAKSAQQQWGLPETGEFMLEQVAGKLIERSSFYWDTGNCEAIPKLEIGFELSATSKGKNQECDGGEALACFGAYGNLESFNWAKCPGWNGGPDWSEPPGGAGISIRGYAWVAGTEEEPLIVTVPVQLESETGNMSAYTILAHDTDCDGSRDNEDNCLTIVNPDQLDINGDGFGDACVPPRTVRRGAELGPNPVVGEGSDIKDGVKVGANAIIGNKVTLEKDGIFGDDLQIGDDSRVAKEALVGNDVSIGSSTRIGKNATIGDGVTIGNHVTIGKEAAIETSVTIHDAAHIGNRVTIGAGAVIEEAALLGNDVTVAPGAVVQQAETVPKRTFVP